VFTPEVQMEHKLIPASWKSSGGLKKVIQENEKDGWGVAALGEIFGGNVLIMIRDGKSSYEHDVIQIFWKLRDSVTSLIREKQREGWQVAAIGDALGSSLLILKRMTR
jgi:hypothetical protein